ncbi:MAG: SCP2 sterol-binding domain-containing protein [Rhizobacter sp.]|nr:SCP2 sterol-binding domain-containing protein [Rhizobacter sp.]
MKAQLFATIVLVVLSGGAHAAPLMSEEWTTKACEQWNRTPSLVDELAASWIKNDGAKGHKIIHLYRTECGDATRTELRIASKDGRAVCVYGGKLESTKLDSGVDYVMHASTERWGQMGRGEYGPMRAMMFGRLEFNGPKMEAMSVMGPFENFLLLVGKVEGETNSCPK